MSIHPSLSSSSSDKKQRSVLKRTERLKVMIEKSQWKKGDGVFGLPKIKTVRIKIKKEKAKELPEAAAAAATTAAPTVPESKEQATTKATAKDQEKK